MCIHLSHVLHAIACTTKSSPSFEHTPHGNFGDGPGLSSMLLTNKLKNSRYLDVHLTGVASGLLRICLSQQNADKAGGICDEHVSTENFHMSLVKYNLDTGINVWITILYFWIKNSK